MLAVSGYASSDCTGTINSMAGIDPFELLLNDCILIASHLDVTAAVACTTVNVNSFQVPAGETLLLKLLDNTQVNIRMVFELIYQSEYLFDVSRGHHFRTSELGRSPFPSQVRHFLLFNKLLLRKWQWQINHV